ncbi:MAG: hypothetical protein WA080_07360 [Sulfuricurvum sp.]
MNNNKPVVLIYKRTHKGDPDSQGIFGIHDCMGKVRNWNFDAVIGIGGNSPYKGDEGIKEKVNWIGIGASKNIVLGKPPIITFDHFCLFEENGCSVQTIALNLYNYMYIDPHVRVVKSTSLNQTMYDEVLNILALAKDCHASKGIENIDTCNDLSKISRKSSKCNCKY